MTAAYPAPGSASAGAPPPLRRPLTAADGDLGLTPAPGAGVETSIAQADQTAPDGRGPTAPRQVTPATAGLLVGTGLAVAALVVELTTRRPT